MIERYTKVKNVVKQLELKFTFELLRSTRISGSGPADYMCVVESNVYCSDGEVLDKTTPFDMMTMRALKRCPLLFWEERHCIDTLIHKQPPIKVFKTFGSKAAKRACRKINDHIATLVAGHQRIWIREANVAADFMTAAHRFVEVNSVMTS